MHRLRNLTKIVATIGPASAPRDVLRQMILSGVNVCRINFSHGTHSDHRDVIATVRELDTELGTYTAILADLQGPKLRIGVVAPDTVLEDGKTLVITTEECEGNAERVYITYPEFPQDVRAGEMVRIDDGKLILKVVETNNSTEVKCEVIHGGPLSSKKGVNLPNTQISLPCLTPKDLVDLDFAIDNELSWIGLSFVRHPDDIRELRTYIEGKKGDAKIIAKIEKPEAVRHIDEIIAESDALMVARGDLGVEIPMQDVPLVQKEIVRKSQAASKPVIIATQMMESMITSITPTRAEVNDVANAVTDGADAVMLSGETSVGKYPVEVIKAMYSIVLKAEEFDDIYYKAIQPFEDKDDRQITDAICYNSVNLVQSTGAKAIITMTFSGYTAFKLSSWRPRCNVFVFTGNRDILNMLSLIWGVRGFYYDRFVSTDNTVSDVKRILKELGFVNQGDLVVNIASMPIAEKGPTNMLRLSKVR